MLFLVLGSPNEDVPRPSEKEFLELVVKEWETALKQQDEESIVCVYGFIDRRGGMAVYDVGSREELEQRLRELPLDPYANWEIIPLMTIEDALDKTHKKLDSAE
jgi:muconolactone delta-isomerase